MKPVKSKSLRTLNQRFKQFGEIDSNTEFTIDEHGNAEVKQTKYFRVPSTHEPLMDKTNIAWSFYSKKFMQHPTINNLVQKLSLDGDIERAGNLKILVDLREQMSEYKKNRDLDGMVIVMRTMYAMLKIIGYKKGPHGSDEYTDKDMKLQAETMLNKYGIKIPPKPTLNIPPKSVRKPLSDQIVYDELACVPTITLIGGSGGVADSEFNWSSPQVGGRPGIEL